MEMFSKARRAADTFKSFGSDRKGGVAMMVGLAFPMIFIGAGGALDYSNAVNTTQKSQRAMDATVLALTRRDLSTIDIQAEGDKLFRSILKDQQVQTTPANLQFTLNDNVIRGEGIVDNKTYFLNFVGINTVEGRIVSAAIPPAERPIEIALVLDVSGSMSNDLNGKTRLKRLKEAVNGMFDTLDEELPSGAKVSASLVPYSTSVNVGDYPGLLKAVSIKGKGKPTAGEDVWAAERSITDSGTSFSINDSSPVGRPIPFVDALTADGWTAGHIGMAWGVYTLSENWKNVWPQDPAPKGDADKIIVMLSDGKFNTTHNIGSGSNGDGAISDAYFQEVCDLAVQEDITVYTVALALDPVSETKLEACVGSTGKIYKADSANELKEAFKDIARRLGTHRLTS